MKHSFNPIAAAVLSALVSLSALAADVNAPTGLAVYDRACAACHQPEGKGMAGLAPSLAGTLAPLLARDEGRRYVAQVLVHGLSGRIVSRGQVFNLAMPIPTGLSDAELAEVANYLTRDLNGQTGAPFTAEEILAARTPKPTHKEMRELRERLLK